MINLFTKTKQIISKNKIRRKKLLEIISPHIKNWIEYAQIVDIVKEKNPELYNDFGKGVCRYSSFTLMEDLDSLWLGGYIMENKHFRKNPNDFCSLAYKLKTFSLGLNNEKIIKAKLKYIGEIQPN